MSFAPGLLSSLFGDPKKRLQRQANKLVGPENVGRLTNQFYRQGLASPAYSQGQGAIAAGANQASSNIAGSLASRGIGTTGTGAILSGLTPSLVGSQLAGLQSATYQGAQGQAQNTIQQQLANLGLGAGPSQSQQMFAGGLEAFIPYLIALMGRGGAGGGLPTMGQPGFQYPMGPYTPQPSGAR